MRQQVPKNSRGVSKIDQLAPSIWVDYCVIVPLDVCSGANSTNVHSNEQFAGFQVPFSCCPCRTGNRPESGFMHHGAAFFLQSSVRPPSLKRGLLDG